MGDNTLTQSKSLNAAVLFLVFNRFDTTKQVFEAIKKARPRRLYIASDGAREDKKGEVEIVNAIRDYIVDHIDWKCEVKTLFREKNLGPMHSQINSLNWFFENEEEGIILEDDCLPSPSFFQFCEELLVKYRDDKRIFMISGDNFQEGIKRGSAAYYFSIYLHIWGWASWKRSWQCFDQEMKTWPDYKAMDGINGLHQNKRVRLFWLRLFDKIFNGQYSRGWDYRLLYACWRESGLCVIPNKNLIKNIGFGEDSTNCVQSDSIFANILTHELQFPLSHPDIIQRNFIADEYTSKRMFATQSIMGRVLFYLIRPRLFINKLFQIIS